MPVWNQGDARSHALWRKMPGLAASLALCLPSFSSATVQSASGWAPLGKALCTYPADEGWSYPLNQYVSGGLGYDRATRTSYNRIVGNSETAGAIGKACDPRQDAVVAGEYALNYRVGTSQIHTSDPCGRTPTLIFKGLSRVQPDNVRWLRQNELPTFNFYVPGYLWNINATGALALNDVERALIFFTALLLRQCGKLPEMVRVVARDNYSRPREPYSYRQFYAGTYFPRSADLTIKHDNPAEATRLQAWVRARQQHYADAEERRREANAKAAPMLLMVIIGLANNPTRCEIIALGGWCVRFAQQ